MIISFGNNLKEDLSVNLLNSGNKDGVFNPHPDYLEPLLSKGSCLSIWYVSIARQAGVERFSYKEEYKGNDMTANTPYSLRCTLTFGDIYGQVLAWMAVIFVSLAAGLGLMGSSRPLFALVGVGLILVLSLPFLLFAFVTTLLNHISLEPKEAPQS